MDRLLNFSSRVRQYRVHERYTRLWPQTDGNGEKNGTLAENWNLMQKEVLTEKL